MGKEVEQNSTEEKDWDSLFRNDKETEIAKRYKNYTTFLTILVIVEIVFAFVFNAVVMGFIIFLTIVSARSIFLFKGRDFVAERRARNRSRIRGDE